MFVLLTLIFYRSFCSLLNFSVDEKWQQRRRVGFEAGFSQIVRFLFCITKKQDGSAVRCFQRVHHEHWTRVTYSLSIRSEVLSWNFALKNIILKVKNQYQNIWKTTTRKTKNTCWIWNYRFPGMVTENSSGWHIFASI